MNHTGVTGVMAAIFQIENKIKLSFNFCNSLTLQRQVHLVIIWPILTQCFWRGIRQCIFAQVWLCGPRKNTVFLLNCTTLLFIGEKCFAFQ